MRILIFVHKVGVFLPPSVWMSYMKASLYGKNDAKAVVVIITANAKTAEMKKSFSIIHRSFSLYRHREGREREREREKSSQQPGIVGPPAAILLSSLFPIIAESEMQD